MLPEILSRVNRRSHTPRYGRFGKNSRLYNYDAITDDPSYDEIVQSWLKEFVVADQNQHPPVLLDLGSGSSRYLERNSEGIIQVIHADLTRVGVEGAANAVVCDIRNTLPIPDRSVVGVHLKDVLTHIPPDERRQLYDDIRRVLIPESGSLLLTSARIIRSSGPFNSVVGPDQVISNLSECGFRLDYYNSWRPTKKLDWYYHSKNPVWRFVIIARRD